MKQRRTPMKKSIYHFLQMVVLVAGLAPFFGGRVTAQSFLTLHDFSAPAGAAATNYDGTGPVAGLTLAGGTLYGTTVRGGGYGQGAIFAMQLDGTSFTNLHSFTAFAGPGLTNADGGQPQAGLLCSGSNLYGTAAYGGWFGNGTVFLINTNGAGFATLHHFSTAATELGLGLRTNYDGLYATAGLIGSGTNFYGTAAEGGNNGDGTVFALSTNGGVLLPLHTFTQSVGNFINSDGGLPFGGLVLAGDTLYGTTDEGGSAGLGTLYAVSTNGTGFNAFYSVKATHTNAFGVTTNNGGYGSQCGLVASGAALYGTFEHGGNSGSGTIFSINTNSNGLNAFYNFSAYGVNGAGFYTNRDGVNPLSNLVLSGNTLYGTTANGGPDGSGTVFAINTDGTGFTTLHVFSALAGANYTNSDGAYPLGGLLLVSNVLYGTTRYGGNQGGGTVYALAFPPNLGVLASGTNVVLSWPTNYAGFDYSPFSLQSTTNLLPPTVWTNVSSVRGVFNGSFVVTNAATSAAQFFRLGQ
jgi:uncharacterized repeat protein (TIGR03803 family)